METPTTTPLLTSFEQTLIINRHIPDYTLPEEFLTFLPTEKDCVDKFSNGDAERKIHWNTPLTSEECDNLEKFIQHMYDNNIQLSPFCLAHATRYISRARGNVQKAINYAVICHEWRTSYFTQPLTDSQSENIRSLFATGAFYISGRDTSLRPLLVIRGNRIPDEMHKNPDLAIKAAVYAMEYIMRYMLMPGVAETLSALIDMKGLGIMNFPMKVVRAVFDVLQNGYVGHVKTFYVINAPPILASIINVVKMMLTDRQRQKICMLSKRDMSGLHDKFASSQIETTYGGSRPAIRNFPFDVVPGPFSPPISSGEKVNPNYDAIPDAHRILSEYNPIGPLLARVDSEKLRKTTPQQRLKGVQIAIALLKNGEKQKDVADYSTQDGSKLASPDAPDIEPSPFIESSVETDTSSIGMSNWPWCDWCRPQTESSSSVRMHPLN